MLIAALLFFTIARMDKPKLLKLTVRFLPLPSFSFEVDARESPEPKELPW